MRDHATVSDGSVKHRARRWSDVLLKFGVDSVRSDNKIAFRNGAICERYARYGAGLVEAVASMTHMDHPFWQGSCQQFDEVRAMHSECGIPAGGVRDLNWRDRRSVIAKVIGTGPDLGSAPLDRRPEADPLQLANAVRRQEYTSAYLTEAGGLLMDRHLQTARNQRVRCEQAADSA